MPGLQDDHKKCGIHTIRQPGGQDRTKGISEAMLSESFPKLMPDSKHRSTKQRTPHRIMQRQPNNPYLRISFTPQKNRDEEKISKETKEGKAPYQREVQKQDYECHQTSQDIMQARECSVKYFNVQRTTTTNINVEFCIL